MNLLEKIDFGNEAGDDITSKELSSLFYEQDTFKKYANISTKFAIICGKKGVGKSILLKWLEKELKSTSSNPLVIRCRGSELTRHEFGLTNELSTSSDHIKDWMIRVSALINRHIAREIGFPITDDQLTLLETAELDGFKQRNLFSSLLNRLNVKIKGTSIEYNQQKISSEIEILKRNQNREIVLLIDDLDATFQNTDKEKRELSTFFSACRYLIQDLKDLSIRVTLRTDIYPVIKRFDESLDKVDQYLSHIEWDINDFRNLLVNRIKPQLQKNGINIKKFRSQSDEEYHEYIISKIFVNKMDWGELPKHTYRVIYTLSYKRPRWAIQLCKLAQSYALQEKSELIIKKHIDTIWGEYGNKRIADLVSEHKHQCNEIEEVILAFRNCDRRMTIDELLKIIENKIITHMNTIIEGKRASKKEIAQFLYRIGFIQARSSEDDGNYEHYDYSTLPDLLQNRTSDDFKLDWEIHPCYRQALDIKKINKWQRIKRQFIR